MADIQLDAITKAYGATTVLNELTLNIREGEFLTLLGASGCGKSTLLKLLAGLEQPDAGSIARGGENLLAQSPGERDCAMVFQSYALYPHMTVRDNICTPLYMRSLAFRQRLPGWRWLSRSTRERIAAAHALGLDVAQTLGIAHLWLRKPAQLSGGQRQRVALARAMVRHPSLFLFDEPLSNLDANLRQALRSEIRQLHQTLGVTFVYVTHDQHEAMSMSDRVAVMQHGRILQLGTPTEIYEFPTHKDVATFVGAPRMNFLTLTRDTQGRATLLGQPVAHIAPSETVELGFRPHTAQIHAGPDTLAIEGHVAQVEFTGAESIVTMACASGENITLVLNGPHVAQTGARLIVHVPQHAWHMFDASGARLPAQHTPLSRAA